MNVIRFNDGTTDVTVNTVEGSLKKGGGHQDIAERFNAGETPVLRNGVARNGSCIVEVEDNSVNTQTLATLQGLHSDTGAGAYTVTIDDVIYAYLAIIDVRIIGDGLQLISINWKGTLENLDI